MKAANYSL